jgi:hypothetical protein
VANVERLIDAMTGSDDVLYNLLTFYWVLFPATITFYLNQQLTNCCGIYIRNLNQHHPVSRSPTAIDILLHIHIKRNSNSFYFWMQAKRRMKRAATTCEGSDVKKVSVSLVLLYFTVLCSTSSVSCSQCRQQKKRTNIRNKINCRSIVNISWYLDIVQLSWFHLMSGVFFLWTVRRVVRLLLESRVSSVQRVGSKKRASRRRRRGDGEAANQLGRCLWCRRLKYDQDAQNC